MLKVGSSQYHENHEEVFGYPLYRLPTLALLWNHVRGMLPNCNSADHVRGMLLNCKSADRESVEPVELVEAAEPVEPYIFCKRIAVK